MPVCPTRWRLALLLMPIMLHSACAAAQSAGASPPMDDAGVRAFIDACGSHIGNLSEMEGYLRNAGFTPAPKDFAARLLHGGPGNVWLMPLPDRVAVATQTDGLLCRVYVQGGDVKQERSYFMRTIEGIARPGLVVTKTSDGDISTGNGPARYVAYRVSARPARPGTTDRLYSIATSDSPTAPLSAIMTVAAAKAD
jgi:hypothetical protein